MRQFYEIQQQSHLMQSNSVLLVLEITKFSNFMHQLNETILEASSQLTSTKMFEALLLQ